MVCKLLKRLMKNGMLYDFQFQWAHWQILGYINLLEDWIKCLNWMLSYEFWRLSYVLMLHFKSSIFISQVIGSTMLVMYFMFLACNTDPIHDIIKLQLEFAWKDTRRRYLAVIIYRSCNGIDLLYWITFLCHLTINASIRNFLIN